MPKFTIREIENNRFKSTKSSSAIMNTTHRGGRFKEERYLSADDFFAANKERIFNFKRNCKASPKKEIRLMEVGIKKQIVISSLKIAVALVTSQVTVTI